MIGLVKPLAHIMTAAVLLGTLGYLCAIFLTITAGHGALLAMKGQRVTKYLIILVVLAVMRGILHYAEQYCNHFIAFKLLAIIRHQVFAVLRKLCPAKLDGREKGNLISIITTDIELLEVFYAHTISPIMIAILTSLIMVVFIGRFHVYAGIFAVCSYLLVGCVIPLWNGSKGGQKGMEFRSGFGNLNSFVLESLRGIDETIQYGQGKKRKAQISEKSIELGKMQKDLNRMEAMQRAVTDLVILCCSFGMFFLMYHLYQAGNVTFDAMLLATIAMMGSFGPVTALSSLSNNLNQTLASGERVLSLLEEEPMVEELEGEAALSFEGASVEDVTFAYNEEIILKDCNINMKQGKVIGICGKSGCGKSTLLKLLMRFWDVNKGNIKISEENVKEIPTKTLRNTQSYVTQETELFHDSIANNIAIGKPGAAREEIIKAAQKASIHDMIMSLPNGYDTEVGELGDTLSGGEKQKIACASADAIHPDIFVLDEPSSNLDIATIEDLIGVIRHWQSEKKTVIVAEHRLYYLVPYADRILYMKHGSIVREFTGTEFQKLSPDELQGMGLRALDPFHLPPEAAPKPAAPKLHIKGFQFSYEKHGPLNVDIPDLTLPQGEIIGIIGNNGAGKSTFARCLCGLDKKAKGMLEMDGTPYDAKQRRHISYMVMQDVNHQLFTEDVLDELLLSMGGEDEKADTARAKEILNSLDLLDKVKLHPMSLSGGEKQRVAIGSAIASDKKILIFDEPTSGLDYRHMLEVSDNLNRLKEMGKSLFLITHDPELIYKCCTYLLFIQGSKVLWHRPMDGEAVKLLRAFFSHEQETGAVNAS